MGLCSYLWLFVLRLNEPLVVQDPAELARGRDLPPNFIIEASQWLFSLSDRELALFPCGSDP